MANVNIPDLAALTAPAATDEIEVYDASAAANVRLALSYVALTGTANVFTANQTIDAGYRLNVDTATRVQQAVGGAYFLKNAIWNGSAWEYVTTASAATARRHSHRRRPANRQWRNGAGGRDDRSGND
jgi:hypothetical protein